MGEEQVNIWASIARSSNPDWGLESIQQVYDVIAAVGIDQSDERIRYDQHVHGLHPVTFLGAWIYVPYSQESIGCVLTKEHFDRLRGEHGADNVKHGGSMYHGLEWAVINGRHVPAQSIQDGLADALRVLGKATDEWNTFTYHEHQELGESLVLLWNPDRWSWSTISNDVVRIDERGYHIESWKVSSASRIRVGMPCFVLRTSKDPRGIIASGVVLSLIHI